MGKTLDNVKNKLVNLFDDFERDGFKGINTLFTSSSTNQLIPESNMVKELSFDDAKLQLDDFNKCVIKGGQKLGEYFLGAKSGNAILKQYVTTTEQQSQSTLGLVTASKAARAAQIAQNLTIKQSTIAYKAASFAKKAFAMAGNILAMYALSKAIEIVTNTVVEMAQAQENLKNSAKDLGSKLSNSTSSIEDYKKKISELYSTIHDSSSSIEDVVKARVDLMSVQDELISKFGTEKGVIENITEAINGQTNALDGLSKRSYYQSKNEFNEKSNGQKVADFISYGNTDDERTQTNMDNMIRQMESSYYNLKTTGNEALDSLIAKSYGLNIVSDLYGDGQHFQLMGPLEEIQEKLYGIQDISSDFDVSAGFENSFTTISNEVDSSLASFQNLYDQYILWEKILNDSPDNQYDSQFAEINKAKESYDNAFKSGDESEIKNASENFAATLSSAMNLAIDNYDDDVANYFANMYPELQQQVGEWKFDANFEPNTNGLKDKIQNSLTTLTGYSTEDILNFNPIFETKEQQDAYADLKNIAQEYGLTLDQLIAKLEKEKIVASETTQAMQKKYGSKINELSDEDFIIAAKVSDGSVKSWEELIAKIDEYKSKKDTLNKPPTFSISDTITQLDAQLKPSLDSLKSAYQQIFTMEDGKEIFSIDNLDLSSLTDLQEKFSDVYGFDTFLSTVTNLSSTSEKVHNAFNDLASSFLYSQDTLENLNDSTAGTIAQQLNLLGVSNSQELVTEALAAKTESLALQKQFATEKGLELANAEAYQVVAFLDNAGASETARQYLLKLIYTEQVFNNQDLSTKSKVEKLNELAKAYGDTAIQSMTASIMVRMDHDGNFDMDSALNEIQQVINTVNNAKVDIPQTATPSTKSTGKSTTDEYLDSYKKELSELEQLHSMEEITDREFYETLRDLNQTYFNDTTQHHEKYLDEYQSNEEKVAQGLKDVWTKYWEDYKSDLDKVSSYAERVLSKQIDSLKDKQEQEVDGKEQEIDAIDDKISALNKEKDATEKLYQDQIDAIQGQIDSYNDEIDKLKEINEEKNRQLKLEQDLYELERLRNQKTQKEYVEGKGTVYKADSSAIRDQEQQVENDRLDIEIAGYENLIKGLESQQDSLKEKMDSVITSIDEQIARLDEQKEGIQEKIDSINQGYEAQIEALERYKEKWTEVSDYQAILDEEALAKQLLGVDAEQNILDMREGILNDYISKYQLATDNLTLLSDAKLFEINEILAKMQAAADLVDTTSVKENLSTTGTIADTTRDQISNVTAKFNDLAGEVSAFTLPPINTEQFIASLGTAEGSTGILGQLQTFTNRFREICSLIPTSWQNALDSILGSGPTDGKGIDYNILFIPLLSAMDNCKLQMDTKLAEYATAWIDFNTNLGAIIGIGSDTSQKDKPTNSNNTTNENEQELNPSSANSILSTIKAGGKLINEEFDTTWIPGFQSMGRSVNYICSNIVSCVKQMAEKTVDACRKAIDAINKANAAKDSSGSNNAKPPEFHLDPYKDISFDFTKPALKSKVNSSLAGELGAKLVFNEKTNQFRYVSRNSAEFADLSNNLPERYTKINRTEHMIELQSKSNPAAIPQDIDITRFLDLPVITPNMDYSIPFNRQFNSLNNMVMRDISPTPVTQEINLTLPNVTNESGAQYIIKTLKQLPSDTIQYTHRR